MNYRHAFHAGNFADLVKHATLLQLLTRLTTAGPLSVIDTHAGRGMYDLAGPEARKSGARAAGPGGGPPERRRRCAALSRIALADR